MAKPAPQVSEDKDTRLPPVEDGELALIREIAIVPKKTKPPLPYTEGTLVADMEGAGKYVSDADLRKILKNVSGIGTSATRAAIVEGLKLRGLLEKKGKNIVSTPKGRELIAFLPGDLYDVSTTAKWEAELETISKRGGGPAFEKAITAEVTRHVAALKQHAPMTKSFGNKSTSERKMSSNAPTDKMIKFAQTLADKKGEQLPPDVLESFDACKQYLDANKDVGGGTGGGVFKPSEKQLNFAESIAKAKGVSLADDLKSDAKKLSAWIDTNKDSMPAAVFKPSEKQLSYATSIAQKKGVAIPNDAKSDSKKLSAWIDKNK